MSVIDIVLNILILAACLESGTEEMSEQFKFRLPVEGLLTPYAYASMHYASPLRLHSRLGFDVSLADDAIWQL
jgi:hypothetical protein